MKNLQPTTFKTSLFFILILSLGFLPASARAQPPTVVYFDPPAAELAVGDTFEVAVKVSDAVNVNAFDIIIKYDPKFLELVCEYNPGANKCVKLGDFLKNPLNLGIQNPEISPGSYQVVVIQISQPGQSGDGTLAFFKFKGIAHGASNLTLSKAQFADPNGDGYNPTRQHGSLDVKIVPTAVVDTFELAKDTRLTVTAPGTLANDSGGPGAALTTHLVTNLLAGTGTLALAADGGFTYDPPEGYTGLTSFTYKTCDGTICSAPAMVNLAVKTVPTALADTFESAENQTLTVAPPGTLTNDSGDGPLSAVLDQDVTDGTLTLAPDGGFTYTPPQDWTGETSFTYTACDGAICSPPAAVTLVIKTVPTALADTYEMAKSTTLNMAAEGGLLANDSGGPGAVLAAQLITDPVDIPGVLDLALDGGFSYTPPEGYTGITAFTYKTCNGTICSAPAGASIAVKTIPTALNDAFEMTMNETLTLDAPGVLGNDSGDPGATLVVEWLTDLEPDEGQLTRSAEGGFTYTPPVDWRGVVSFTYRACDGTICSTPVEVHIEVFPPRDLLTGEIYLQSSCASGGRGGIPVMLVGETWDYTYQVKSLEQVGKNLPFGLVVLDFYQLTTLQPRYLNLHPELAIFINFAQAREFSPLMLVGGNTHDADNVINISDASLVGTYYGLTLAELEEGELLAGDANFDGVVDIADLALVGGNYMLTSADAYADWINGLNNEDGS